LLGGLLPAAAALAQTSTDIGVGTTSLDFQAYDPSANASRARLQALDNDFSADLFFLTKVPGASANGLVERLRISRAGLAIAPGVTMLAAAPAVVAPTPPLPWPPAPLRWYMPTTPTPPLTRL
jgi:hypothetical protein